MVEQETHNPLVAGSNPAGYTKKFKPKVFSLGLLFVVNDVNLSWYNMGIERKAHGRNLRWLSTSRTW